jgi:hypothetical protein
MYDAPGVRGGQTVGHLDGNVCRRPRLERAAVEMRVQWTSFQQLHGDVRLAAVLADLRKWYRCSDG